MSHNCRICHEKVDFHKLLEENGLELSDVVSVHDGIWRRVREAKCPKCKEKISIRGNLCRSGEIDWFIHCVHDPIKYETRNGKKMKKCSTNQWNAETKQATGCDYVEWINGTTEALDEDCPTCGNKLVLYTTAAGKKMKKCSTSGWDAKTRTATGCTYVEWLKPGEYVKSPDSGGEEFLPPDPNA